MVKNIMTKYRIRLVIVVFILLILSALYTYANIKYQNGYNIIITNSSENDINDVEIFFGRGENKVININCLKAGEKLVLKGSFKGTGENLYAVMPTEENDEEIMPLAYIYLENYINIVKINITDVSKENKAEHVVIESFDNFPSLIPPWWIRILYDYSVVTY